MKRRMWVVGGSIGAVILLLVMSFHPVIASSTDGQSILEKHLIFNNSHGNEIKGFLAGPTPWMIFLHYIFDLILSYILGLH